MSTIDFKLPSNWMVWWRNRREP